VHRIESAADDAENRNNNCRPAADGNDQQYEPLVGIDALQHAGPAAAGIDRLHMGENLQ
jgi:hypothetical protein